MISKIYNPCTCIDEPQLRILTNLLTKICYSYSELTQDDIDCLREFMIIFKSHLL